MTELTLGSLFDGSGGFPLAGLIHGIKPLWASEIEPFPIRVTTKRLPFMKHYGDINTINGAELEPVDIITFGSPCTDMSIAGQRNGITGKQSVLFFTAIRIIKEMRRATNEKYPRFIVWENVPGAFSSGKPKGGDFRCVLEEIAGIADGTLSVPMPKENKWLSAGEIVGDGFSIAWRTLDAQFWGVPQRRRRIFLVADFSGESAGSVLFDSESVSGHFAPGIGPWERFTAGFEKGAGETGGVEGLTPWDVQSRRIFSEFGTWPSLYSGEGGGHGYVLTKNTPDAQEGELPMAFQPGALVRLGHGTWEDMTGTLLAHMGDNRMSVAIPPMAIGNHPADSRVELDESGTIQTLTSRMGTGGGNVPLVMDAGSGAGEEPQFTSTVYGICSDASNSMRSDNPCSGIYEAITTRTLDTNGGNPTCKQGGMVVVFEEGCVSKSTPQTLKIRAVCPGGGNVPMVLNERQHAPTVGIDVANTLTGTDYKGTQCVFTTDSQVTDTGAHHQTYSLQGNMIGRADQNGPQGSGINEDVCFSLTAADRHSVAYSMTTGSYTEFNEDVAATLMARDYKDPQLVSGKEYVIRRLIPRECLRLQGFPEFWCDGLRTEKPTSEEIDWWAGVFETHRIIAGESEKPKSRKQIIKWLKNPNNDSAEYKMWGNGVALPCVSFVLAGIVWLYDGTEACDGSAL